MHFRNIIHYGNYIQPYHFQSFKDIPRSKTYLGQNYQHFWPAVSLKCWALSSTLCGFFYHWNTVECFQLGKTNKQMNKNLLIWSFLKKKNINYQEIKLIYLRLFAYKLAMLINHSDFLFHGNPFRKEYACLCILCVDVKWESCTVYFTSSILFHLPPSLFLLPHIAVPSPHLQTSLMPEEVSLFCLNA